MAAWESPVVQQLLADERIALSRFLHADAFVRSIRFSPRWWCPGA